MTASLTPMGFATGCRTNRTRLHWTGNESQGPLVVEAQGLPLTTPRAQVPVREVRPVQKGPPF